MRTTLAERRENPYQFEHSVTSIIPIPPRPNKCGTGGDAKGYLARIEEGLALS